MFYIFIMEFVGDVFVVGFYFESIFVVSFFYDVLFLFLYFFVRLDWEFFEGRVCVLIFIFVILVFIRVFFGL